MRLDAEKLRKYLKREEVTLERALLSARLSKTTYYHLARKQNLLPKALCALAAALKTTPYTLITQQTVQEKMQRLYRRVDAILTRYPKADRQNVLHTLLLLQENPLQRLQRSLQRGRYLHFHR